ncbi:MAG: hypothetical protein U9P63_03315 [Patescibacteria group bacterium]|nr:hypothetical protein [Patescibacteria group bacterium]
MKVLDLKGLTLFDLPKNVSGSIIMLKEPINKEPINKLKFFKKI